MAKLKIRDFKNSFAFVIEGKKKNQLASLHYTTENKKLVKRVAKKLKKQLKKAA